jgi:S-formylglutathione hydrolase FrmB
MTVILPEHTTTQIGMTNVVHGHKHPTLYLLHGLSDDHTTWTRRTSIERYVSSLGIAVVMPQVDRSFYTDMAYGNKYWTFVSEELPRAARSFFPLSDAREDNFVAGLSMGGYGAFKLALSHPDRFAAAASLSGALNMADPINQERMPDDYRLIYGHEDIAGTDNDLITLLQRLDGAEGPTPQLFQSCGTEDFLYDQNTVFREACSQTSFDLTYEEGPGDHTWEYWDTHIQRVLHWLPLRK